MSPQKASPVIGIIMGSKSDSPKMQPAVDLLDNLGVACEVRVLSAHRNPEKVADYAVAAVSRGIRVIIAGAGLSAALPGALAAHTTLPVIGVPIASGTLGGIDSLISMVQMPGGVPVATVGLGKSGAVNAAILAVEILAVGNPKLTQKLEAHKKSLEASVRGKNAKLRETLRKNTRKG